MYVCVCANIFIGFYLHCSNCAISHCTITNSFCRAQSIPIVRTSREPGRERKRGGGGGGRCVCVSRAFYVFFAYFPSMQAKWIYGNFSNAFGTIMANGAWHIDALTRRPQWKPFRSIASAGSLSLPLLLHLLHPSLTDLKLQLAGLLRFPLLPSSAQCKQFSVLLIEMAKWRM